MYSLFFNFVAIKYRAFSNFISPWLIKVEKLVFEQVQNCQVLIIWLWLYFLTGNESKKRYIHVEEAQSE